MTTAEAKALVTTIQNHLYELQLVAPEHIGRSLTVVSRWLETVTARWNDTSSPDREAVVALVGALNKEVLAGRAQNGERQSLRRRRRE
jgi:hypothetical protein